MDRDNEKNWAEEVPWERGHGPYEDYGWERGDSVLPEFRDSSVHNMPYEMNQSNRWNETYQSYQNRQRGGKSQGRFKGVGPHNYQRSDNRIMDDVSERLAQHGRLDASKVQVKVNRGEVELDGSIRSRSDKRLVEDIIETVHGVKDIHNRLRVQSTAADTGQGRVDRVGRSGVYPASGPKAPEDSEVHTMASWGQGDRGAKGYEDHGDSELPTREDEP